MPDLSTQTRCLRGWVQRGCSPAHQTSSRPETHHPHTPDEAPCPDRCEAPQRTRHHRRRLPRAQRVVAPRRHPHRFRRHRCAQQQQQQQQQQQHQHPLGAHHADGPGSVSGWQALDDGQRMHCRAGVRMKAKRRGRVGQPLAQRQRLCRLFVQRCRWRGCRWVGSDGWRCLLHSCSAVRGCRGEKLCHWCCANSTAKDGLAVDHLLVILPPCLGCRGLQRAGLDSHRVAQPGPPLHVTTSMRRWGPPPQWTETQTCRGAPCPPHPLRPPGRDGVCVLRQRVTTGVRYTVTAASMAATVWVWVWVWVWMWVWMWTWKWTWMWTGCWRGRLKPTCMCIRVVRRQAPASDAGRWAERVEVEAASLFPPRICLAPAAAPAAAPAPPAVIRTSTRTHVNRYDDPPSKPQGWRVNNAYPWCSWCSGDARSRW